MYETRARHNPGLEGRIEDYAWSFIEVDLELADSSPQGAIC